MAGVSIPRMYEAMESWLKSSAQTAGLVLELLVVLIVVIGSIQALAGLVSACAERRMDMSRVRAIWVRFAASILLALEFALAADLVRTAVAPSWDDIGQLAAIAAIRTALGFFLGRDVEEFRRKGATPE